MSLHYTDLRKGGWKWRAAGFSIAYLSCLGG